MMLIIKKIVFRFFDNKFCQNFLEKNVFISQYLMGIGAGACVENSGELVIFKKLKDSKKNNYCVFDVGANKGDFTKLATSSLMAETFQIHCFEPSKSTFAVLANRFVQDSRVILNNIGLGKTQGEFDLFHYSDNSGLACLTKRRLDHFDTKFLKSEKILIDTIDNYCSENNIKYVDLLKIDVEGHELDVLRGAQNMLKNNSVKMISFEFGGCNIDTRTFFQDFYYFFKKFNFQLYRITPSEYLYPINSYKELYEQFRTTNFLAVNKS